MNAAARNRAVFLDRDGVLIRSHVRDGKPYAIADGDTPEILDGVAQACADLAADGFKLVLVTNQPDVARGKTSREFVETTNHYLKNTLKLDLVSACLHDDKDDCACRKPKPGLITEAAQRLELDTTQSVMVGDRWKDIDSGRQAGCWTVFIDCGYNEKTALNPDFRCTSLAQAVPWIRSIVLPRKAQQ